MAEYIEREALRQEIDRIYQKHFAKSREKFVQDVFKAFFKRIDKAPAADVAPVVHGRWDDSGRYQFPSGAKAIRCSICGCALNESEYRLFNWNYCPVCGAKMELEGGNT